MNLITPIARYPISVRLGTIDDLPFIDRLQKKQSKQVGWLPTKSLEEKIGRGNVVIASAITKDEGGRMKDEQGEESTSSSASSFSLQPSALLPLGYLIAADQYFKRDDVGIIYQINVAEGRRRGLVGAALLRAQFERSAWGCRLYGCWCAQDIEANRFWEAMGFVPLAFRAGSAKKGRVHIYWQRRIRAGDVTTPYWFPSQTSSGSIREDRLVLPIPPGVHWSEQMPRMLPEMERQEPQEKKRLPGPRDRGGDRRSDRRSRPVAPQPLGSFGGSKLFFAPKPTAEAAQPRKEGRPRRKLVKNDPRLVAAARELRDRWLERVNSGQYLARSHGKYEVGRFIESAHLREVDAIKPAGLLVA